MSENNLNGKDKFISLNIDTTIEEIELKESIDGKLYQKIDSLAHDGNDGVVNKIVTTLGIDACGSVITKREELTGVCSMCRKPVKIGNDVRCQGRCARLMCLACYQRQGGHELHGRKYCRHDYWQTKLFWQFISPGIRNQEARNEQAGNPGSYREPGNPAFRIGRQVRAAQQEIRQPDKVSIIKAR